MASFLQDNVPLVALMVAGLGLCVSVSSLIWSIKSKFIHPKAKLVVRCNTTFLIDNAGYIAPRPGTFHYISLSITNYGPAAAKLTSVIGQQRRPLFGRIDGKLRFRPEVATLWLTPIFSMLFPVTLGVAETFEMRLGAADIEALRNCKKIGFKDTFNRIPSTKFSRVVQQYLKMQQKFNETTNAPEALP